MALSRQELLKLNDQELLKKCRVDTFRATGPGGQHRNKTDSAVRLTLSDEPMINATAVEDRSQHRNRLSATKRLRREIAYQLRQQEITESWTEDIKMNIDNPRYPFFIALLLDALFIHQFKLGDSAKAIDLTTGQLNKAIQRDKQLWTYINTERQKAGLKALRIS
jgi:hypothetical protein